MDESAAAATTLLPATTLNRHIFQRLPNQNQNGTTTPTKSLPKLDTVSLKSSSYTSLKDMLPFTAAAVNSPTASAAISSGHEISIHNRLVKQAAWAYLQPMSASPSCPSGPHFLRRLRHRFSSGSHRRRNLLTTCLSFTSHLVTCFTRVLHQILHAIRSQGLR